ncbi:hypothetical protein KZP23_15895 [Echinicola marina]|uniref:hypothetical protein n=1 Tax=Echinicola marina TaxID=2859768 RepID=UPI001CF68316|nr:hypothetical protein [Echinicola marina]UCS92182.1 hypothetical protein KZP23_15895 [Echinicola marina]
MIDGFISSTEFWRTVGIFLALYYCIVLALVFGPALLYACWKKISKTKGRKGEPSNSEFCKAFQEYAHVYQSLGSPQFNQGRLLIPSHIQLDLLLKQPFCRAVERESSSSKPS